MAKETKKKTKKHWVKGAIKHKGVFSAAAKRAGMSTAAYAQAKKKAPGVLGKRARLAITLGKLRRRRGKRKTTP